MSCAEGLRGADPGSSTATADVELFPGERSVRFSTTEPRALRERDRLALKAADPRFLRIFCDNAWRDWHPLWCIDRGVGIDPARIDFARWLSEA